MVARTQLDDPDVGFDCNGADDCSHEDHDEGDEGPMFHTEPVELERDRLVEWYFADLSPICGTVWM